MAFRIEQAGVDIQRIPVASHRLTSAIPARSARVRSVEFVSIPNHDQLFKTHARKRETDLPLGKYLALLFASSARVELSDDDSDDDDENREFEGGNGD